ncbi:aminoglycoside phosphotransferase family protein [Lysinibacillus sp. 54212]|uniref:aminoglycoside phosphotransferase family protein n=1 Tax=Lysinibacillus sp. 54212 TaxID=3119829 RepID=UPI002FC72744
MDLAFEQRIIANFGEVGEQWLARLPTTIEWCNNEWGLVMEEVMERLSYNYIIYVIKNDKPYVLKLGVPGNDISLEMLATELYGSQNFVRLLAKNNQHGAQLLERIQPGCMLSTMDEERAIEIFCSTWQALRAPADERFPHIYQWFSTLHTHEGPILKGDLELAAHFAQEIMQDGNNELLHGDLHHYNILYDNKRGWCGIDPKGINGDKYFDCIPFILNECQNEKVLSNRIEQITQKLSLNRNRLIKAAIALTTVRSCWATEDEEDWYGTFEKVVWLKKLL